MADQEYTTKIRIEADTKGGVEAEKTIEKVGTAAKKANRDSHTGFADTGREVGKVTKAVGLLHRAMAGFGVVTLFTSMMASIDKLFKKYKEATKAAEDFRKEAEKAANAEAVEKLAAAYDKLGKSISDAATARKRANELEDIETSSARDLEDINAQAAKDAELAALDPNDPYYAQKKAQVEAKYGAAAAGRTAQRKVEDAQKAQRREGEEAAALGEEAAMRQAAIIDDRAQLDVLKRRRDQARAESVSQNDLDANRISEVALVNLMRVAWFQGGWRRFGDERTVEGDAKRKEAEDKAKALDAEIKAKEKDIAEKERKIAELESEAAFRSRKSVALGGAVENAMDAASVARAAGYRSEGAAAAELSSALGASTDAARAKALVEAQIPETQRQIYLQKQRIAAADASVAQAQAAYDTATGSAKGTAAQRLAQVTQTAKETKDEADRLIKQLNETLNGMKSVMNAATSALNKNNSQRLTSQAQQYVSQ